MSSLPRRRRESTIIPRPYGWVVSSRPKLSFFSRVLSSCQRHPTSRSVVVVLHAPPQSETRVLAVLSVFFYLLSEESADPSSLPFHPPLVVNLFFVLLHQLYPHLFPPPHCETVSCRPDVVYSPGAGWFFFASFSPTLAPSASTNHTATTVVSGTEQAPTNLDRSMELSSPSLLYCCLSRLGRLIPPPQD